MPSPGQVNNPTGANSYGSSQREEPYGAIERRKVLTRMAPLPPNSALNAPKRYQRQATSKKKQPPPAPPIQTHAADQASIQEATVRNQPEKPVDAVAQFWEMMASERGASALVKAYAAAATRQPQLKTTLPGIARGLRQQ